MKTLGTSSACWDILVLLVDSPPTSDTYYMIFNVDMYVVFLLSSFNMMKTQQHVPCTPSGSV